MGSWFRGVCHEVPSGDTIILNGPASAAGPPPQKRLVLASLVAPKMARRDGHDEPFAWAAREFLRKKAIGQPCTFRVDYTLPTAPGLEFGTVFMGKENLALLIVAAGWAKVRASGGQQSPYIDELLAAQAMAETQGLGVFTKDPEAHKTAVRSTTNAGFDAASVLASVGKGKPLPAIVERVQNGSTLQVTLLPDLSPATVMVCGIQAPSMGRRPPPAEDAAPDAPAPEPVPEPLAREAKHFTETRVLNREVRVVLEGVDKHGHLLGSLAYPEGDAPVDLGEKLVSAGLAKTTEWGLNMMITGSFKLREAERKAKQGRLGLWRNYVPPAGSSTKQSGKFTGIVTEVVSGDVLSIRDSSSGAERRVTLSSIRAPRPTRRDEKPEPYGLEAKEFLRQRLIGKEVSVSMEYERAVGGAVPAAADGAAPPPSAAAAQPQRMMSFGTVTLKMTDGKTGAERDANVAEMLLVRGLANVARHRIDEERSAHFEQLMLAEESGKKNRKGLHSSREPPVHHVNDVTLPNSANRAKQYLPFFQRAGRVAGVCEYVLSGHRVKVHVPKEGVTIAFSPSGVRAPQRGQAPSRDGRAATEEEPYWEESYQFTRELALQREVEVEVETVDRGGTFLGTLRVTGGTKPVDLGLALLSEGLAKLHPSFEPQRVANGEQLATAEAAAREKRLKVWEKYVEPAAADGEDGAAAATNGHAAGRERMDVVVTEIVDGGSFWAQKAEEPRVAWLQDQMRLVSGAAAGPRTSLATGALCLGQFSADDCWYRARVEAVDSRDPVAPRYSLFFVDYGNRETVPAARVRPMDAQLAAVPPQALLCSLAYLKVPSLESELGMEAGRFLSSAAVNKRLVAIVERRERAVPRTKDAPAQPEKLHVLLSEPGSSGEPEATANAAMLEAGLAQLQRPPPRLMTPEVSAVIDALATSEDLARRAHRGLFEYGDPGDDDEDDAPPRPAWGRR